MFKVSRINDADFDKIILQDNTTNTSAEIVPLCGGILNAFKIIYKEGLLNIIDGFANAADFKNNVTAKGFKSCKLSPFACRIKNAKYNFENRQYAVKKFLLGDSALHGLLYDAAFEVINTCANEEVAEVTLQHKYNAHNEGFPFKYTCTITYQLKKNNALTITTVITNDAEIAMPLQDGWHPYFSFDKNIDDLELQFNSREIMQLDNDLMPTGLLTPYTEFGTLKKMGCTVFDNCFTLNTANTQPVCILKDSTKKIQLEIYTDKTYPYLQIYTPPHRKSIAIENLSAAPNVFNNGMGLIILQHQQTINFTTTFKISFTL